MTNPQAVSRSLEISTIRKVRMRIIPFIFLLYIVAVLDRVNIGFAALTMNKELGITAEQFGLLAGIFFIGYFLFEIPSNLMLHKVGARIWIARILISWGIISFLTALSHSAVQLYIVRFLLGLAEAGFFPGMILYLTYWFRQREQAQAVAFFMTAQPIASIVGAPVSGWILDHIHWMGISSWRWLLALEAMPAVILGVLTFFILPNKPEDSTFLDAEQKAWLAGELHREEKRKVDAQQQPISAGRALMNGRVWYLAAVYFTIIVGLYSLNFWLPQVVKGLSKVLSNTQVGLLVMVPHLVGLTAMILISLHSDRTQERRFHAAIPAFIGGVALLVVGRVHSPAISIALLALMALGIDSFFGPFWSLPNRFLAGIGAASGIALINSVGNLGGFVGPYVIGAIKDRTGSVYWGLAFVGISMIISAILVMAMKLGKPQQTTLQ
jgi:ACS family tartrate transporter-like MFS transporter